MRGLTIAVFLAGCGAENSGTPDAIVVPAVDATIDWEGEFTWEIGVGASDVIVRIDGVERTEHVIVVEGEAAARELEVVVETEVGGVVASSWTLRADCDADCQPSLFVAREDRLCGYASGELRLSELFCEATQGTCIGDGWCLPRCGGPLGCPAPDDKCGIDRVDGAVEYGWLDCVPVGSVIEGGVCTIDAQGLDDCAEQLHCVGGTCRRACRPYSDDQCGAGVVCDPVPGFSPEAGICPL